MSAALLRTVLWVGLVDAVAGATLLGFLYTPESNVLMLAVSALLVVLAGALLVLASAAASHALVHGVRPWTSVGAAHPILTRIPKRWVPRCTGKSVCSDLRISAE